MVGRIFLIAMITCSLASKPIWAQGFSVSQVDISIKVESNPFDSLSMFVFVKGKLSGIAPGIIALPSQESVPVEIGIAQLDESPLYSFNFGPEALKANKLDVVIANIDPISLAEKNFLILHKDAVKSLDLTKINDGVYELKLPGAAPLTVARSAGKNNIFVGVSVKKADDYGLSSHLVYNEGERKAVSMGNSDNWSGTNTVAFSTGAIGNGLSYVPERQKWTIQSAPEGADIYTDTHPGRSVGKTNSTVDVTESISSYALLKMDGYQQCVIQMNGYQQCTEKDCRKDESTDGSVTYVCNLKKVQINR
jgi:hypothetical protein